MTLIEGIGDEVLQFFGILLVVVFCFLAWWSTGISDIPVIRTVLILERRTQTVSNQQRIGVSEQSARPDTGQIEGQNNVLTSDRTEAVRENKSDLQSNTNVPTGEGGDSSNNDLTHNLLHEPSRNNNESDDIAADSIRIRLKYLNDDQKLVEGRLHEQLGEFKRRHFRMELSAQKLVRLIFNGQVLQRDDQTLQGCGLYDNCVVHCLVHAQQNMNRTHGQQHMNTSPPDWNLGGLLYFCLCIVLAFAWICRYNYSHLFTLTTTTALVGLTGLFAVSVVGLYMPEQEATPRT